MRAEPIPVGTRLVDSLPYSQGGTRDQAMALGQSGIEGLVGYLGSITRARVDYLHEFGMGFNPVTFASAYDGAAAVQQCRQLGLPDGTTVWLDLEGKAAFGTPLAQLVGTVEAWAQPVAEAGYMPGLYVGVPQPLPSDVLYRLQFIVRYWRGQGSIRDRFNQLAEPTCGWCQTQMFPSVVRGGVLVDIDIVGQDYHGRVPAWAVGS